MSSYIIFNFIICSTKNTYLTPMEKLEINNKIFISTHVKIYSYSETYANYGYLLSSSVAFFFLIFYYYLFIIVFLSYKKMI